MNAIINHIRSKKHLQYSIEEDLHHGKEASGNPTRERRRDHLYDIALYFIAPHRFKPADLLYIQKLAPEVTVALVCAKADAMTVSERNRFQLHIRNEIIGGATNQSFDR